MSQLTFSLSFIKPKKVIEYLSICTRRIKILTDRVASKLSLKFQQLTHHTNRGWSACATATRNEFIKTSVPVSLLSRPPTAFWVDAAIADVFSLQNHHLKVYWAEIGRFIPLWLHCQQETVTRRFDTTIFCAGARLEDKKLKYEGVKRRWTEVCHLSQG